MEKNVIPQPMMALGRVSNFLSHWKVVMVCAEFSDFGVSWRELREEDGDYTRGFSSKLMARKTTAFFCFFAHLQDLILHLIKQSQF